MWIVCVDRVDCCVERGEVHSDVSGLITTRSLAAFARKAFDFIFAAKPPVEEMFS